MLAHGNIGRDTLEGGSGNDSLFGDESDMDLVRGRGGADLLDGGAGVHDLATYSEHSTAVTVTLDKQPARRRLAGRARQGHPEHRGRRRH